ncbi:MAG TPA: dickkopf-related protein [Polyangiaceae bacterium]|nr:dickkopf-related protein [Polyangiaceae bacterium]
MTISSTLRELFTPFRPARAGRAASFVAVGLLAAAAFGGAGAAGCNEAEPAAGQGTDDVIAASVLSPAEVFGAKIAAHPLFGQLSQRSGAEVSTIVQRAASRPEAHTLATLATLRNCQQAFVAATCMPAMLDAGLLTDALKADRAQALQIAADVGLKGASLETVGAAFRVAEWTKSGPGGSNPLAGVIAGATFVGEPDWACDGDCREQLGNELGGARAGYHASLSRSSSAGGAGGSGAGGSGGSGDGLDFEEVQGWIEVAKSIIELIDELVWDTGEKEKECLSDSDCPSSEYCHKIGENDCRADRNEGALCSRGTQCEGNCCKPHISTFFAPSCRPASACN